MAIEHGKIGTYTNHKCKCAKCRLAWKVYQANWKGQALPRQVTVYYARRHICFLLEKGYTTRSLSEKLQLDRSFLRDITNGKVKKIRTETEDRILACNLSDAPGRSKRGPKPKWR